MRCIVSYSSNPNTIEKENGKPAVVANIYVPILPVLAETHEDLYSNDWFRFTLYNEILCSSLVSLKK